MRLHSLLSFSVMSLCCVSQIAAQDDSTGSDLPIQIDEQLQKKVDDYITPMVDANLFGGSILLSRDGQIVARKSYGAANEASGEKNTPRTKFKLMSTSKTFTAVAIMTLVQDGKLTMDDAIGEFLEGCPAAWKTVTIRQLLSHTSNIPNLAMAWGVSCFQVDDFGLKNWKVFAPQHLDSTLTVFPQDQSRYSNFNYVLLGLVIESTSGQPYQDYIRQHVLKPAGTEPDRFRERQDSTGFVHRLLSRSERGLENQPTEHVHDPGRGRVVFYR